jgi:hypothetical protein
MCPRGLRIAARRLLKTAFGTGPDAAPLAPPARGMLV